MTTPIVAYYRVSTQGQGRSGLGLEAQRKAVEQFAAAEAMHVAHEFVDVERRSVHRRRTRQGR